MAVLWLLGKALLSLVLLACTALGGLALLGLWLRATGTRQRRQMLDDHDQTKTP